MTVAVCAPRARSTAPSTAHRARPTPSAGEVAAVPRNVLLLLALAGVADASTLQGGGSSLVSAFYTDAFRLSPVPVTYTSLGSSKGVCRTLSFEDMCSDDLEPQGDVDFGASERLVKDEEYEAYPDVQMYPAVAAGVVPAFNLPEIGDSRLILTLDIIAQIYIGQVTHWNNASIVAAQEDAEVAAALPHERIVPVARASGSGTSFVWTGPLAEANADFAAFIGATSSPAFDDYVDTVRVSKSSGMASVLATTPYTLGYLQMGDAFAVDVQVASILKDSGSIIDASLEAVELAVAERGTSFGNNGDDPEHLTANLHSAVGDKSWPISGFGYNLLRKEYAGDDCEQRMQLLEFFEWLYTSSVLDTIAMQHSLVMPSARVRTVCIEHIRENLRCNSDLVDEVANADVPQISMYYATPFESVMDAVNVLIEAKGTLTTASLAASTVASSEALADDWDTDGFAVLPEDMPADVETYVSVVRVPFMQVEHSALYNLCGATADDCDYSDADPVQMDAATLRSVLSGDITAWNDDALTALNPWLADVDLPITVFWAAEESEGMLRPLEALGGSVEPVGEHFASTHVALANVMASHGGIGLFSKVEGSFASLVTAVELDDATLTTNYDIVTRREVLEPLACGYGSYAAELLFYLKALLLGSDAVAVIEASGIASLSADAEARLFDITCNGESVAAPKQELNVVSDGLRTAAYALCGMALVAAVLCALWTVRYRDARVVRYAQAEFLIIISVGCAISLASTFFMGHDDVEWSSQESLDNACMAQVWLYCIGFGVTYSALLAKTYRVRKVFRAAQKMKRVVVSLRQTLGLVALFCAAQAAVLGVWQMRDPLVYTRVMLSADDFNEESVGSCDSATSWTYLTPLAVVQGLAYVYGNVLSYQTRNVDDKFAESKYLAACMFQGLQVAVLCVPVAFMTSDDPPSFFVVLVGAVWLQNVGVLGLVIGPKVFSFFAHGIGSPKGGNGAGRYQSSTASRSTIAGRATSQYDRQSSSQSMSTSQSQQGGGGGGGGGGKKPAPALDLATSPLSKPAPRSNNKVYLAPVEASPSQREPRRASIEYRPSPEAQAKLDAALEGGPKSTTATTPTPGAVDEGKEE